MGVCQIEKTEGLSSNSEHEVRITLDGRRVLTEAEVLELRLMFETASVRARRTLVTTYLLQGLDSKRLAKLLKVPVEEVEDHYQSALKEIEQELDAIPEGPLLVAQVVIEGYSRYVQRVMSKIDDMVDTFDPEETDDPRDHIALQGYLKLGIDTMDKLTDRLEKYGMLPVVPQNATSHGGVRNGSRNGASQDPESYLRLIAEKAGIDLEAEKRKMIQAAVVNNG